jgi:opacity protein-like surface antigen
LNLLNAHWGIAMKHFLLFLVAIASFTTTALADTYVQGYVRKDGTYVQPHYRSSPDSSYNNNWSVQPNVNPYTGEVGTKSPTWNDQPPSDYYGGTNRWYR